MVLFAFKLLESRHHACLALHSLPSAFLNKYFPNECIMNAVGQKLWHMLCVSVLMFEYGVSDVPGLEHFPFHNEVTL